MRAPKTVCPRQVVLSLLDEHAQQHPLNRALAVLKDGHWQALTYLQLAQRVRALAARFTGLLPDGGEAIAILSESGPAWGTVALATLASRNVLVLLDTYAEPHELTAMIQRARPRILFASPVQMERAFEATADGALVGEILCLGASALDVDPADPGAKPLDASACTGDSPAPPPAVMAFTSGTSGAPKAVEISFDSLLFQMCALTRCFALRPSDRLLSLLPMHHMLEFTAGFLCPLWCGAQVHYLDSLLPGDALREIRSLGITRMITVPAWLSLLMRELKHHPTRPSARQAFGRDFEHFVCGGAALADDIREYFDHLSAPVLQGYGLTETGPVVSTNTAKESRSGSVGKPLSGTEASIAENGEILVRGPHVAARYRLDGDVTEPVSDSEGWFHTGDLGCFDSNGFLYITGRAKSTIVLASGKNVQPEEVEACLEERAEVAEVAVLGLSDPRTRRGEEICAIVVPSQTFSENCQSAGEDAQQALRCMVTEAACVLAPHKRPKRIVVRPDALPRTAAGKLKRAMLAEWAKCHRERVQ